jgi:hypothetical protein
MADNLVKEFFVVIWDVAVNSQARDPNCFPNELSGTIISTESFIMAFRFDVPVSCVGISSGLEIKLPCCTC